MDLLLRLDSEMMTTCTDELRISRIQNTGLLFFSSYLTSTPDFWRLFSKGEQSGLMFCSPWQVLCPKFQRKGCHDSSFGIELLKTYVYPHDEFGAGDMNITPSLLLFLTSSSTLEHLSKITSPKWPCCSGRWDASGTSKNRLENELWFLLWS
jgi:hypothetical protein